MFSVRDSEIATQIFFPENLKSAVAHYYRQYCIDPRENFAVAVCPSGRYNADTDQGCGVIILVTTLTGNPPDNTHRSNRTYIANVLRVL
jgi:hypothetical protein